MTGLQLQLLSFRRNTYVATCVPCCIQSLAAYPFGFQWAVTNDGITIVGVVTAKAMRNARGGEEKQPPKDTHM